MINFIEGQIIGIILVLSLIVAMLMQLHSKVDRLTRIIRSKEAGNGR